MLARPSVLAVSPRLSRLLRVASIEREVREVQARRDRFSFDPDLLFVWIPKAAGSSLVHWLNRELDLRFINHVRVAEGLPQEEIRQIRALTFGHMSVDRLIDCGYLEPGKLSHSFSFCFVRNPYTRVISVWKYLARQKVIPSTWTLDYFVFQLVRERPTPGIFNELSLSHGAPMVSWVRQTNWSGPKHVFRFEQLTAGFSELAESLGVKLATPADNVGDYRRTRIPIRLKTLRRLENYYEKDFVEFGYDPKPPTGLFEI